MTGSRQVTAVASLVLLFCLAASILSLRQIDQVRGNATLEEVLFVSSPKMVKRMSLGYDGLMADIYWTRAVQYFGGHHADRARDFRLLAPLLEITTALDPKLLVAYQFGANFLAPKPPNGAGMPQKAIELVNNGIENNPNDWNLYYELGFVYYMELKDYERAAQAFAHGSQLPGAHPFLKIIAAQMAQHAGDNQMARALWMTTYQSTQDKQIRGNAIAHLRALQVSDDIDALQELVGQYGRKTGVLPRSMTDLVGAGLLRSIPLDPTGRPYRIASDGRIEVQFPDELPFLEKGVPRGYTAPQPKHLDELGK
jgi:tetratricopeptide (TPR) repeat protein